MGMADLPETAQKIIASLVQADKSGQLAQWDISLLVDTDISEASHVVADHDLKRARINLNPEWQRLVPGSLKELLAHEVGHLLTNDVFCFVKATVATREAEERIATRIGLLLLGK